MLQQYTIFQSYRGRKPLGGTVSVGLSPGLPAAASPGPAAPAAPSPAPATAPAMKQEHPSQPMVSSTFHYSISDDYIHILIFYIVLNKYIQ